jgi:hypothetical protein
MDAICEYRRVRNYIKKKYLVTRLNNRLQDRIISMPILSKYFYHILRYGGLICEVLNAL